MTDTKKPAAPKKPAEKSTKAAEAPPAVVAAPKKSTAEVLREALAAKKAAGPSDGRRLRPDTRGGSVRKDAERLAGKSRKVH